MSLKAERRGRLLGYLAAAVAVAIWAAWIVWLRVAVSAGYGAPLTPIDVGLLRFGAPAVMLAPVWLRHGFREGLKPAGVSWPTLIAMLGWGAPFVLLVSIGVRQTSVAHMAALVPGVMPLWAAAFAWLLFRERFERDRQLGFLFIAAAVALTIGPALSSDDASALFGAPWLLAAAALWACFAIAYRRSGLGPIRAAGVVAAYSVAALLALAAMFGSRIPALSVADFLWLLLLHGVLSGVVSIVTYTYAIQKLGPARAASLAALVPVLAATMGLFVLGEPLGPLEMAALISASVGVALVNGVAARWRPIRAAG